MDDVFFCEFLRDYITDLHLFSYSRAQSNIKKVKLVLHVGSKYKCTTLNLAKFNQLKLVCLYSQFKELAELLIVFLVEFIAAIIFCLALRLESSSYCKILLWVPALIWDVIKQAT